jgi:hypothetical protein
VDSIFMMPQLGVLAEVHPAAATEVFEKDCLIWLGTCVAARGTVKPGRTLFTAEFTREGGRKETHEISFGELKLVPLGVGESVKARLTPGKGCDVGWGPGKTVEKELHGGGRPIAIDASDPDRVERIQRWASALDAYPEPETAAALG